MRKEMEDARGIGANAAGDKHVTELRTGRVGDDALDVVLNQSDGGRKEGCYSADERHHLEGVRRMFKQR